MTLLTEPIGSVPRSEQLLNAMRQYADGSISQSEFHTVESEALRETISRFEETGSPIITDGEQSKSSFATYPLGGDGLAADGVVIPFADGHTRQLPRLTRGPFKYAAHAAKYLKRAQEYTRRPLKQAVISASALSLLYPAAELPGYSKSDFISDLLDEAERDIRQCLDAGATCVQIDFTEGRLALKLDPSAGLLKSFIELNNQVLERFTSAERRRIGVHSCPGGDHDSTHSADVNYADLLRFLFDLKVGRFYLQLASESKPKDILKTVAENRHSDQIVFIGVTDPINPRVEAVEEVRDRVLQAAEFIPVESLGTTDDCGFSPFADDVSTSRDIAFAKIQRRVQATELASATLGV
jgi:5-methyltetrahydropteroyltriglutamate--homocysteine methyltransferase